MSLFGSSPSLTVIYSDEAVLNTVLDLATQFSLRASNDERPEQGVATLKMGSNTRHIILKSEANEISGDVIELLRNGIEELHGFNTAILHASPRGNNTVAAMEIHI